MKPLEEESPVIEPQRPTPEVRKPDLGTSEPVSVSTDDKWARPSEIDKDRIRTTPQREITETEKAMQAFSRADHITTTESKSGIVEERMLRASEVHEMLEKMAAEPEPQEPEPEIVEPIVTSPPAAAEPYISPATTPDLVTEERHVPVIDKPKIIPIIDEPIASPIIESAPEPLKQQAPAASESVMPSTSPTMEPVPASPISKPAVVSVDKSSFDKSVPEVDAILSKIKEHLADEKIKDYVTRLTPLYVELKLVRSEMETVLSQLDEELRNYRNTAEVKRITYENLEEQIRLAKESYADAKKEFERAESRREKECSTRQKRIKDIEKRIGRGEDAIEKRVHELEKS